MRIIYPCKAKGEIVLSHEHDESRWVGIKSALKLDFVDIDYRQAIERFVKDKESEEFIHEGMQEDSIERRKNF